MLGELSGRRLLGGEELKLDVGEVRRWAFLHLTSSSQQNPASRT